MRGPAAWGAVGRVYPGRPLLMSHLLEFTATMKIIFFDRYKRHDGAWVLRGRYLNTRHNVRIWPRQKKSARIRQAL